MKLLCCGSRGWTDKSAIRTAILDVVPDSCPAYEVTIVEGEAAGADRLSKEVGEELGMPVKPYPAHWHELGLAAGHLRNQQMLDENPDIDLVLAFDLGTSGTADMCRRARAKGLRVQVYRKEGE